jgi:hypothetical protein
VSRPGVGEPCTAHEEFKPGFGKAKASVRPRYSVRKKQSCRDFEYPPGPKGNALSFSIFLMLCLSHSRICIQIKKLTCKSRQSPSSEARSSAENLSSDSDMDGSIDESLRHTCQNSAGTCEISFVTLAAGQRDVADTADEERAPATATADHGRNSLRSSKELPVVNELAGPGPCLSAAAGPGDHDA